MSLFSYKIRSYRGLIPGSSITVAFYRKFPVQTIFTKVLRSTSDITIKGQTKRPKRRANSSCEKSKTASVSINGTNKLEKDVKDTEKRIDYNLHIKNMLNHNKKGPVYQEEVGPDVKVVWIADPTYCAKIFGEGI